MSLLWVLPTNIPPILLLWIPSATSRSESKMPKDEKQSEDKTELKSTAVATPYLAGLTSLAIGVISMAGHLYVSGTPTSWHLLHILYSPSHTISHTFFLHYTFSSTLTDIDFTANILDDFSLSCSWITPFFPSVLLIITNEASNWT